MSNTYTRTDSHITYGGYFRDDASHTYASNSAALVSIAFRCVNCATTAKPQLYLASAGQTTYKMKVNNGAVITIAPSSGQLGTAPYISMGNDFYEVDLLALMVTAGQTWNGLTGGNDDVILFGTTYYKGVPRTGTVLTLDGTIDYFRDAAGIAFSAETYSVSSVAPANEATAPTLASWINLEGGDGYSWENSGVAAWNLGNCRLTGLRFRASITDFANTNIKVWSNSGFHFVVTYLNLDTTEYGSLEITAPGQSAGGYDNYNWITALTPGTLALPRNGNYEFGFYSDEYYSSSMRLNNIAICGGGTLVTSSLASRDMVGFSGDSIFSQENNAALYPFSAMPWGMLWADYHGQYGIYLRSGNGATVTDRNGTNTVISPFNNAGKIAIWTALANPPKYLFLEPGTNDSWSAAISDDATNSPVIHSNQIGSLGGSTNTYFLPSEYAYQYGLISGLPNTYVVRLEFLRRTDSPSNNDMETYINSWNTTYANNYYFKVTYTSAPAIGDTYTNNLVTYTITKVSTSGITGEKWVSATGSGAPQASGTLTRVTGSGDITISFSRVETAPLAKYSDYITAIHTAATQANSDNAGGNGTTIQIITYADLVNIYGFDITSQGTGFLHPSGSDHTVYRQMTNWLESVMPPPPRMKRFARMTGGMRDLTGNIN